MKRSEIGQEALATLEPQLLGGIKVGGKSLLEWKKDLYIKVPQSDDPDVLASLSTEIAVAAQKAEYLLASLELQVASLGSAHEQNFAKKYVSTLDQGSSTKKLSAEKIKQMVMVDELVDSTLSSYQTAKMTLEFFKRIVKGLEEMRKAVDSRIRLIQIQARFMRD